MRDINILESNEYQGREEFIEKVRIGVMEGLI